MSNFARRIARQNSKRERRDYGTRVEPSVNLDQQEIARKQIAAQVRLKRIDYAIAHFNGTLEFLKLPAEARNEESNTAANRFASRFFDAALVNVVDLSSDDASEAFGFQARLENFLAEQQRKAQPPPQ